MDDFHQLPPPWAASRAPADISRAAPFSLLSVCPVINLQKYPDFFATGNRRGVTPAVLLYKSVS